MGFIADEPMGHGAVTGFADHRQKARTSGGLDDALRVDFDPEAFAQVGTSAEHGLSRPEDFPSLLLRCGATIDFGAFLVIEEREIQGQSGGKGALAVLPADHENCFTEPAEPGLPIY